MTLVTTGQTPLCIQENTDTSKNIMYPCLRPTQKGGKMCKGQSLNQGMTVFTQTA